MAEAAIVEDGRWLGELHEELRARLAPVFCQARSRLAAFAYIGALLTAPGERRSCWQLAEQAGLATPQRMQALLAEHQWEWREAPAALQRFILARLADPEAVHYPSGMQRARSAPVIHRLLSTMTVCRASHLQLCSPFRLTVRLR